MSYTVLLHPLLAVPYIPYSNTDSSACLFYALVAVVSINCVKSQGCSRGVDDA